MFLGGVWRRLWPTAIPRYKVLALRPPVVCVCVCVTVFGVCLLAKVSIANCSSTEPCNFRTTETNAGRQRQRQRDMLFPLSLPLPHCITLYSPLPTLHEALSCQMFLLFQKGLLHPSEVYAPEIFPVFWWGVWGRVSRVSRATLCAPCEATPSTVLRPCLALISPISCKKCRPAQRLSTLSSRFDNFLIYGCNKCSMCDVLWGRGVLCTL